jgi:putative hydrolase of the HAD superfamily
MLRALIFDWGGTVMADSGEPGPMYLWKEVALVPGIGEALAQLRNFTTCIATNAGISDTGAMIKALKRVGADALFSHFFSSKELGYSKPDPGFFLRICEEITCLPEECVMIGNDYEKDICGAKRAGMKTVFFDPGGSAGPFPLADAVIGTMDQLPELIKKWQSGT